MSDSRTRRERLKEIGAAGAGHGSGGAYGEHKRFDFFVRHLLGVTPAEWTKKDQKASTPDRDDEQP